MSAKSIKDLIEEVRSEAESARAQTRPDPEGYGSICHLEADDDLLDRVANALEKTARELEEAKRIDKFLRMERVASKRNLERAEQAEAKLAEILQLCEETDNNLRARHEDYSTGITASYATVDVEDILAIIKKSTPLTHSSETNEPQATNAWIDFARREDTALPYDENSEREKQAQVEAEAYAPGDEEAQDDYLTGWRTADRTRPVEIPTALENKEQHATLAMERIEAALNEGTDWPTCGERIAHINAEYRSVDPTPIKTKERDELILSAIRKVQELTEAGKAGEAVRALPKNEITNWGWLQNQWPVVVAVDNVLESLSTLHDTNLADDPTVVEDTEPVAWEARSKGGSREPFFIRHETGINEDSLGEFYDLTPLYRRPISEIEATNKLNQRSTHE